MTLSADVWRSAAVLAGLRVAANDPFRAADRDRGAAKNWLADIWGTFGELSALRRVEAETAARVRHTPIDFNSAVDAVDLLVQLDDGALALEAKAHMLEGGKRWFMINRRAHERSVTRGAVAFLPILSVLGGPRALVGRPLLVADVGQWPAPSVTLRDPALGRPLDSFLRNAFRRSLAQASGALAGPPLVMADELRVEADRAAKALSAYARLLPPLSGCTAANVVTELMRARAQLAMT